MHKIIIRVILLPKNGRVKNYMRKFLILESLNPMIRPIEEVHDVIGFVDKGS